MSLIKCSECGREISDKAVSCPHCGNPISSQPKKSNSLSHMPCPNCGTNWHTFDDNNNDVCKICNHIFTEKEIKVIRFHICHVLTVVQIGIHLMIIITMYVKYAITFLQKKKYLILKYSKVQNNVLPKYPNLNVLCVKVQTFVR